MKKYIGFTLSETLVTLGIIGVVAAMTIPNLLSNWQAKHVSTKLKATHSILVRAMRMAEEEYGEIESWELDNYSAVSSAKIFNNIKPFLKVLQDCGDRDVNSHCISKTYKRLNGVPHDSYGNSYVHPFVLLNGTSVFAHSRINENGLKGQIIVFFTDINGPKPPNVWGRDLFAFAYNNGFLYPYGSKQIYYWENYCKNKHSAGFGCAYYVMEYEKMDYLKK